MGKNTSYNRFVRVKSRFGSLRYWLKDVTFKVYLERTGEFNAHPDMKKLTNWESGYMSAVRDMQFNEIQQTVVHHHYYEGRHIANRKDVTNPMRDADPKFYFKLDGDKTASYWPSGKIFSGYDLTTKRQILPYNEENSKMMCKETHRFETATDGNSYCVRCDLLQGG